MAPARRMILAMSGICLAAAPITAQAYPKCVSLLLQRGADYKERSVEYLKDVKRSKGLRLLLRKSDPNEKQIYGGFFAMGRKRLRLTPFSGLYHQLVRRPVWAVTDRSGLPRVEASNLVRFVAFAGLSYFAIDQEHEFFRHRLNDRIEAQINSHPQYYDDLIANDFRFNDISEAFKERKVGLQEARDWAFRLKYDYDQYYSLRPTLGQHPTLKQDLNLLPLRPFEHLKGVIMSGVVPMKGYVVPTSSRGPLSEAQILKLFEIDHELYLKYAMIPEIVNKTSEYDKLKASPNTAPIVATVMDDPFAKAVFNYVEEGKIPAAKTARVLEENEYWKALFRELQTIGVQKEKLGPDGKPTGELLQLSDIQREILSDYGIK